MLDLAIVNKILRHCNSWLARQYICIFECDFAFKEDLNLMF